MTDYSHLGIYPIFGDYVPLEASASSSISSRVGQPLPKDLLDLSAQFGCAGFQRAVHVRCDGGALPVAFLFGGGNSSYSMLENLENTAEELPSTMVPFAGDELGNIFFYSLDLERTGIFWWKHTEDVHAGNPKLCMASLEAFMQALHASDS